METRPCLTRSSTGSRSTSAFPVGRSALLKKTLTMTRADSSRKFLTKSKPPMMAPRSGWWRLQRHLHTMDSACCARREWFRPRPARRVRPRQHADSRCSSRAPANWACDLGMTSFASPRCARVRQAACATTSVCGARPPERRSCQRCRSSQNRWPVLCRLAGPSCRLQLSHACSPSWRSTLTSCRAAAARPAALTMVSTRAFIARAATQPRSASTHSDASHHSLVHPTSTSIPMGPRLVSSTCSSHWCQ